MTLRRTIVFGGILVAALAAGAWYWHTSLRSPGWNVLLITLSATRADHLGCYGHEEAETPTIDSLAERGILFERAISTSPSTLPAHASLLTGLHPLEHGLITNRRGKLADDARTLAEVLSDHGYRSAAFIAAYELASRFGLNGGFESYDDDLSGTPRGPGNLYHDRPADSVVDNALAWLELQSERPLHCWIHLHDPAPPFDSSDGNGRDLAYDDEIANVDRQLARVVDFVDQQEFGERTLIVIAGDHGVAPGERAEQGSGALLHDATLHVPLIIVPPATAGIAAMRIADPVSGVDVAPTLLDLLGIDAPRDGAGISLASAMRNEPSPERACLSMTANPLFENGWSPQSSLTTSQWRYVESTVPELYDLLADPDETRNLAAAQPEQVAELAAQLKELESALRQDAQAAEAIADAKQRALAWLSEGAGAEAPKLPDVKDKLTLLDKRRKAQRLLEDGRPAAAEPILRELLAAAPHFVRAWDDLGQCLVPLGQTEEAIDCFERVLQFDPRNVETLLHLAAVQSRTQRFDDSMATYEAAIAADPKSPVPPHFLGLIKLQQGDEYQAELLYAEAVRRDPTYDPAICSQGELALHQGDGARAVERFDKAIAVNPNSVNAILNLGVYAANGEEFDAAEEYFRRAVEVAPDDPLARESLARIELFRGRPAEAVKQFEAILEDNPDHSTTVLALGWLRAAHPEGDIRDLDRARELADQAVALLGDDSPDALDLLAVTQANAGDFDQAVVTITQALELASEIPNYPLEQMGRRHALYTARQPYRTTLTEKPTTAGP